ncbi:hypothetical protein [Actinomadura luteofluorescens]|uniref:hypothetical protein n=1 Tax=Actinomadura luteofluorescens TaxID=46163 RepID=UPI003D89D226
MAEFGELLASARLPETGVPLCLRGDLQLRHEQLEQELAEAQEQDRADDSLAGGGRARKVAEQIRDLEAEMRDHTHTFALRALNRRRFRDLVEAHPPREDNQDDRAFGVNSATFPVPLIAASCTDPVMTAEQVEELLEVLTEGQMLELYVTALQLNRAKVDVPKSFAASELLGQPAQK